MLEYQFCSNSCWKEITVSPAFVLFEVLRGSELGGVFGLGFLWLMK